MTTPLTHHASPTPSRLYRQDHVKAALDARLWLGRKTRLGVEHRAKRTVAASLAEFRENLRGAMRDDALAAETRYLLRCRVALEIAVIRQCRRERKVALKG